MQNADRRAWQRHPITQLAAVAVGVLPIYALVFYSDLAAARSDGFQFPRLEDTLLNMVILILGFGSIMLLLLYLLCGQQLRDLQLKRGSLIADIAGGLFLTFALLGGQLLFSLVISQSQNAGIPAANVTIAYELAEDPLLLAFWLGPLVWLQAGLFEEFTRVFMLSRLWQVWPGHGERWAVLLGSALLFGLGHAYQGTLGIIGTALIGFILGWHYLVYGRVLPLIIGHALYDTIVILSLVTAVRYGLL
jgi:membrane protease YdiL (CAAX protease family)